MIKVGDTFEVVKVLGQNPPNSIAFKIGGTTIKKPAPLTKTLLNGTYKGDGFKDKNMFNQQTLYLHGQHIKSIGKLKITKVKWKKFGKTLRGTRDCTE